MKLNYSSCRPPLFTFGLLAIAAVAAQSASAAGPDVVYSDCTSVAHFGNVGAIHGYTLDSLTCNIGDQDLIWANQGSPGLAMNGYRLHQGRLEQIGLSWVKHACCAGAGTGCGMSCNGHGGSVLGVGCRDVYGATYNGGQSRLGPRSGINAYSGQFSAIPPGSGDAIYRRMQITEADMSTTTYPGALFFMEGVYVGQDDAATGNWLNNASYKRVTFNAAFEATPQGTISMTVPAIYAWRDHGLGVNTPDPNVTILPVTVPGEGRIYVGYKVTNNGNGTWRYEYAIYNLSSDRAIGSFNLPIGSASLSNVGFHDINYHSGEPYSSTDWTSGQNGGYFSWSCQTFQQNQNANAIRWGTMYNFWFTATTGPIPANAQLGIFKPGSPNNFTVALLVPDAADCNSNGVPDGQDIASGTSHDCNVNFRPDECDLSANDCNGNTIPDDCEVAANDCNTDGVIDGCQLAGRDCDNNGQVDACQPDCDRNGVPNACEPGAQDCNHNAIPDSCDVAPRGGPVYYGTAPVNLAIPDNNTNGGVTHTITVPNEGVVTDVNVHVQINHTRLSDLTIRLSHIVGNDTRTQTVWNRRCSNFDNMNVTFDDLGVFVQCANPTVGTFRPNSVGGANLSGFNGRPSGGAWRITVIDNAAGELGTLVNWAVTVATPPVTPSSSDANQNGVPDECECPTCRGDTNADGGVDGADTQGFVNAMIVSYSQCADMDGDNDLDAADLANFVDRALNAGGPCP